MTPYYSTEETFEAYIQSWGSFYLTGRPIGPYPDATVLQLLQSSDPALRRLRSRQYLVQAYDITYAARQRKSILSSWQQFEKAGKPRDAVLDSRVIFGLDAFSEPDTTQWAVCDDELTSQGITLPDERLPRSPPQAVSSTQTSVRPSKRPPKRKAVVDSDETEADAAKAVSSARGGAVRSAPSGAKVTRR